MPTYSIDGIEAVLTTAEDSIETWNGAAVPYVTLEELAAFLPRINMAALVGDFHDEVRWTMNVDYLPHGTIGLALSVCPTDEEPYLDILLNHPQERFPIDGLLWKKASTPTN